MAKTKGASKPKAAPKRVEKLPQTVKKPARPTKPSLPLPPPPPAPPPTRAELDAPRDIGRLLRYGEKFGAKRLDIRMLTVRLPVTSGMIAICDPGVPRSWRVLDRPVGNGAFGVMLSLARSPDGAKEALAAVTIHVGRPPIARWTVAHAKGQKPPKSADQIPRVPVTTGRLALVDAGAGSPGTIAVADAQGVDPIDVPLTDGRHALAFPSGNGEFAAYWAVDAADKPVCLVLDFDVFTQKDWKAKP